MKPLFPTMVSMVCLIGCVQAKELLTPADMSPPQTIGKPAGKPIELIRDSACTLPIVIGNKPIRRTLWAAEFLAKSLGEMCGKAPRVIKADDHDGPAIFIGVPKSLAKAKLSAEGMEPEAFAVKTLNGSLYLYGKDSRSSWGSAYATIDFAERILGVRQYFEDEHGGRTVVKAADLTIPALDYGDAPVFKKRELWPYGHKKHLLTWRIGGSHPVRIIVHAPHKWGKDKTYRKERPEIFELNKDGTRTNGPMLCYGHPKTLETYLERIDQELKGGRKSGVINGKTVTVSPWDKGVSCHCEHCRKLFDPEKGTSGSASRIMYEFTRKLSDELAKRHPELTIIYLPYLNYCDIPAGADFPARNVEVELCSMPGLAMFKDPRVKQHEEKLIRGWAKVSGRKIQNWHYICWPAEFTSAPYVYAEAAIKHYQDTKDVTVGSFLNGGYPEQRHLLSAYAWMKALWNPDLDADAIFDTFATRMYGPAAPPIRRLIALQAEGWKRPWEVAKVSPKNIFEISYPRAEVKEMEACFAKAYKLAGDDKLIRQRIDYYKGGFTQFFKESKEHAEGTAFAPLMIKKAAANPTIDGKLDDPAWKAADALSFVRARDRKKTDPIYPTHVRAVWTPDGITFGLRMTEPTPDKLWKKEPAGNWHNDNIEIFFDVTGKGGGDFYQIIVDARNEGLLFIHAAEKTGWKPKGIKSDIHIGRDFWSAEVFIPFTEFKDHDGAQLPKTSSAGLFWIGNFTRHRKADAYQKDKTKGSVPELTRLNTRYSAWSADLSAFGKLKFVE